MDTVKRQIQTYQNLLWLRKMRDHIGHGFIHSVTITLNGEEVTVHSPNEADEILEAYADWFEKSEK